MRATRNARPVAAPRDLYQEVTDRIVAALEAGVAPWRPAHTRATLTLPRNGATGRPYHGVNVLLLWIAQQVEGYATAEWLTFNQARAAGGSVRKGEHGTVVTLWRPYERKDRETQETTQALLLRHFVVFNRDQIDGLPPVASAPVATWQGAESLDLFVQRTGAVVREGLASVPCYKFLSDTVHMPARTCYPEPEAFYGDLMHELVHWTGHPSRLDRRMGRIHTPEYAREELVAELGAAFVCATLGITGPLTHAEYLNAWLGILKADKRAIFAAASAARQAAAFLTDTAEADAED